MKCQILFSGKNKKNISKCRLLKVLPRVLSIKCFSLSTGYGIKAEEKELEDFNVRVFYDKLEDQNLHLAAQLARQKEDLKKFYDKIYDQNEGLKELLKNLDPQKLEELQQRMEERDRRMRDKLQAAPDAGPTIVNANLTMGGAGKYKFAG